MPRALCDGVKLMCRYQMFISVVMVDCGMCKEGGVEEKSEDNMFKV